MNEALKTPQIIEKQGGYLVLYEGKKIEDLREEFKDLSSGERDLTADEVERRTELEKMLEGPITDEEAVFLRDFRKRGAPDSIREEEKPYFELFIRKENIKNRQRGDKERKSHLNIGIN